MVTNLNKANEVKKFFRNLGLMSLYQMFFINFRTINLPKIFIN